MFIFFTVNFASIKTGKLYGNETMIRTEIQILVETK